MDYFHDLFGAAAPASVISNRLIEIVQAIVLVTDREGRVLFYNSYLEQLSGIALSEARGKDWFDLFLPERDRDRIRALYVKAVAGERVIGNLNPIRTRGGEERDIEWSGSSFQDERGETIGVLSVGIDVTARRTLERELVEKDRLATIGTTAGMLAHEVGNPLNNMSLQLQLLARSLKRAGSPESATNTLDQVQSQIHRLSDLLGEFRDFARRQHIQLVPTDLRSLVDQVFQSHLPLDRVARIRFERHLPDDLPAVPASADKLAQVLVNLFKNALEAMPDGGTLRVEACYDDDAVSLKVQDTGQGIGPGVDVFQPFETTKPAGTGLGLPIAKQIVLAHGGELFYESEVGEGTTFTVNLPRRAPHAC